MLDTPDLERLHAIGLSAAIRRHWEPRPADQATPTPFNQRLMRVVQVQREGLTLHDGESETPARLMPALRSWLAEQTDAVAVGDWVLAERNALGEWWACQRMPPINQLARRIHDGRNKVERVVIVSNVDTALLVMGLDKDFNLRRLERYAALVVLAGVTPVVVLTKADLCADHPERVLQRMQQVQDLLPEGAAVLAVCALEPDSARQLAPWLAPGKTLVLLGSSGAGKSTLTNTLSGVTVAATGANREGDQRGRHTTTARTLHRLPQGACIIDTPGLRTLRLDGEEHSLGHVFDDIARLATDCRFRDCRHEGEPGCAVRDRVGTARLKNYNKLLRELQRDTLTALERRAEVQMWKARSRQARAGSQAKRG